MFHVRAAGYSPVPTAATREGGDVIGVVLVAGIFAALAGLALIGWARDRHRDRAAPSGDPWTGIVRELRSARVADDPLIPDNRQARRF